MLERIPAFTTRVDQTNGSTLVKLILFEKSRVEFGIRFFNLYDKSPETPWKLRSFLPSPWSHFISRMTPGCGLISCISRKLFGFQTGEIKTRTYWTVYGWPFVRRLRPDGSQHGVAIQERAQGPESAKRVWARQTCRRRYRFQVGPG